MPTASFCSTSSYGQDRHGPYGPERSDSGRKGTRLQPFTDGRSFSASIRNYVDSAKARGEDPTSFVNDVWRARIDKEWREALSHESMLGATEYAALDKYVSTLSEERFDLKFVLYMAIVVVLVALVVWRFRRKPKALTPETSEPPSGDAPKE